MPKIKEENVVEGDTLSSGLEVPNASDVVFKHTWCIKKYNRTITKKEHLDSPTFYCCVNGMSSSWNVSVRFWKKILSKIFNKMIKTLWAYSIYNKLYEDDTSLSATGKRLKNPIVICLNLASCVVEEPGQAKIRFQFGVWDAAIKHWECCPMSRVALNLQTTNDLLSVGHRDLSILKRHIDSEGNVSLMVKIQIIQTEDERHSLSQDFARIFVSSDSSDSCADCEIECARSKQKQRILKAHSLVIRARSPALSKLLREHKHAENNNIKYHVELLEFPYDLVLELLRYLYTDKVDNLETNANRLLPVATRFSLPGLVALCERALLETLTPANVANILLLADQCGCEILRKAALNYCEDSTEIKENVQFGKSLAWRVMELVNPELFLEACESLGSSSSNLDSPGSHSEEHL